ncbi:MAG: archaetidylinositol phosphate synthase [Candidatus Nitrosocaldaceae archaeon]
MLNKIRSKIEPLMNNLGLKLASLGLTPNTWTVIGFFVSILSAIVYSMHNHLELAMLYGGIVLLVSGFVDMIDGSVARVTKRVSKKGAFLDSTLDRVSEVAIYAGILYSNVANDMLVLVAITSSLLVSYARARAESLGIELKGIGIGERAERLLILSIASILSIIKIEMLNYGIALICIIAIITFIQRIIATLNRLS